MKNVKTLLIFITISTFVFASTTRTDALGGAGFWAEDYANINSFPASVNNHNVAWTDGYDFTSVFVFIIKCSPNSSTTMSGTTPISEIDLPEGK